MCEDCPAGTYEDEGRLCRSSDSRHVVPAPRSNISGRVECTAVRDNSRVLRLIFEDDGTFYHVAAAGGDSLDDCICEIGYYAPPSNASSCVACP